jgi:outer membrane receptor for ferrienterochelin and colicins
MLKTERIISNLKFAAGVLFLVIFSCDYTSAQKVFLKGTVKDSEGPLTYSDVVLPDYRKFENTDASGTFSFDGLSPGKTRLKVSYLGYTPLDTIILLIEGINGIDIVLVQDKKLLDEVVVSGNLRETSKDKSAISIDIITPKIFQKTSTPNLFDATGMINGVRPQNTCNVCNTGEIQINSLGGPYTLVMIDGMPIVSGLSSVYGMMGIPVSMIRRLEVAKGPASALYGSEAMGGVINIITKDACNENHGLYIDYYGTSWFENNLDLSKKFNIGSGVHLLSGINTYWYNHPVDKNGDGFTDAAIQKRVSIFNKLDVERKDNREFSLALRGVLEDRWGGQTQWDRSFRGGDSLYAESIETKRIELIGKYQWSTPQRIYSQLSYNFHDQDSYYGLSPYLARQSTGFFQTYGDFRLGYSHNLLAGINYKHVWFDDNTPATYDFGNEQNEPQILHTVGIFMQDEFSLDDEEEHAVLMGMRLDYNNIYKWIPSPRLAYKWTPSWRHIFRLNIATGFRIVNVFTEDHLALSGAREVVFRETINPEKSVNATFNYLLKTPFENQWIMNWDFSAFYYHFTNRIIPDYDTDPNLIIYQNLDGFAFNRGGAVSFQLDAPKAFRFSAGLTYTDVQYQEMQDNAALISKRQIYAPIWSGNYQLSYDWYQRGIKADITGNWTGPMRLPVQPNDFRPEFSPWFSIFNIQLTKSLNNQWDIYLGCKNLFNFLPVDPIMRPFDPFDKRADDPVTNPNGYSFDPSYTYASMQGRRFHIGFRRNI